MKLVRWRRFTWELSQLPAVPTPIPDRYVLRAASRDEEEAVRHVVVRALALDTTWSDMATSLEEPLREQIEAAFEREACPALVITHGPRIIAASVLTTEPGAESHLISGPCVLLEYHNRGLASALLYASLRQLHAGGLETAHGLTRERVAAAKFLYTKFGSTSEAHEHCALVAA